MGFMSDIHKTKVALLDYGIGNILCIQRAFEYCGADVTILSKPDSLQNFTHIVLPGVGAFQTGMNNLESLGYIDFIYEAVKLGLPLMGICLGMQLLFESGMEGGYLKGLGIFSGQIIHIPEYNKKNERVKLPHIGWNKLIIAQNNYDRPHIVNGLNESEYVYFDHTYYANISDPNLLVAETEHKTIFLPAIVQQNKIVGCQFHPEKSGKAGLKIIENFCNFTLTS